MAKKDNTSNTLPGDRSPLQESTQSNPFGCLPFHVPASPFECLPFEIAWPLSEADHASFAEESAGGWDELVRQLGDTARTLNLTPQEVEVVLLAWADVPRRFWEYCKRGADEFNKGKGYPCIEMGPQFAASARRLWDRAPEESKQQYRD